MVYLSLLLGTGLVTTAGLGWTVDRRIAADVDVALEQEIQELRAAGAEEFDTSDTFTSVREMFARYDAINVPSLEEAFVSAVDGAIVRERVSSFPLDEVPEGFTQRLMALSNAQSSAPHESVIRGSVDTELGRASFAAVVFESDDGRGAYGVVILPAGRLAELESMRRVAVLVLVVVVAVAGGCAWVFTGRVLRSMRRMTETARAISDPAATVRVPVVGAAESVEMAETVNAMLDRLRAAHRTQREFLHAAGHELRSPLTVVSGHLGLLEEGYGTMEEVLPVVIDEVGRMGRIVDDLQSLAASEAPGFVRLGLIDAGVLAHELLGKARSLGVRRWAIDEAVGGLFVADRHRLTQAVLNLADNSVRHTGDDDEIAIGIRVDADEVRLWVRDTGVGVAPGDEHVIFERFVRGRRAIDRYRGSGLGLTIVASIAAAHGGRVEHRAEQPGARFTIVLPLVADPLEQRWHES